MEREFYGRDTGFLREIPAYSLLAQANRLIYEDNADSDTDKALHLLKRAIYPTYNFMSITDPVLSHIVDTEIPEIYFSYAICLVKKYGRETRTTRNDYLKIAIKNFEKAKEILEEKTIPRIHMVCCQLGTSPYDDITEQFKIRLAIYHKMRNDIEAAIGRGDNFKLEKIQENLSEEKIEILKRLETEKFDSNIKKHQMWKKQVKRRLDQIDKDLQENATNMDKYKKDEDFKNHYDEMVEGFLNMAIKTDRDVKIDISAEILTNKYVNEINKELEVDSKLLKSEAHNRYKDGLLGSMKIMLIEPINWWSVAGMFTIGLAQVLAGAAIAVLSLGAATSAGMGLLVEGMNDMFTAIHDGIINRSINWAMWAVQKAVSITVSMVTAGFSAAREVCQMTGKALVSVGKASIAFGEETVRLAMKAIGKGAAKGIATHLADELVKVATDKLTEKCFNYFLRNKFQDMIDNILKKNYELYNMLSTDRDNSNRYWLDKIIEAIQSDDIKEVDYLKTYCSESFKGVSKHLLNKKINSLGTAIDVLDSTVG